MANGFPSIISASALISGVCNASRKGSPENLRHLVMVSARQALPDKASPGPGALWRDEMDAESRVSLSKVAGWDKENQLRSQYEIQGVIAPTLL